MRRFRALLIVIIGLALAGALVAPAQAAGRHHPKGPDRIALPDGFQPEGIAIGRKPVAYLGSRVDGDIYAADLRTGRGKVISQGPGTPSLGMKVSGHLLYVAGGSGGDGRVIDLRTGKIIRSYPFSDAAEPFVNDVVLTRGAAWFTDSAAAQLYRVAIRKGVPAKSFTTLTLRGSWDQVEGNNANGITQTPDRRALIVVNSTKGLLYRVDTSTGVARPIDLAGYSVENGDGLLLRGRTLYVVQNRLNKIAVLQLNQRGTRGRLVDTITSPHFDVPSTVAAYRGSLYLPNARFTTPPTPSTPYSITRVAAGPHC